MVEIVADADRDVLLRFSDGIEGKLAVSMDMAAALQELQAVGVASKPSKSLWQHLSSTVSPAGITSCNLPLRSGLSAASQTVKCLSRCLSHQSNIIQCMHLLRTYYDPTDTLLCLQPQSSLACPTRRMWSCRGSFPCRQQDGADRHTAPHQCHPRPRWQRHRPHLPHWPTHARCIKYCMRMFTVFLFIVSLLIASLC